MTLEMGKEERMCTWLAASEEVDPLKPLRYIELEGLDIPSQFLSPAPGTK